MFGEAPRWLFTLQSSILVVILVQVEEAIEPRKGALGNRIKYVLGIQNGALFGRRIREGMRL